MRLPIDETPAEVQVRLAREKRCRELAELLKANMSADEGFVLITATYGAPAEGFMSTSYVATVNREDSVRLLQEVLDNWQMRDGSSGEPSARLCTTLRETVHRIVEESGTPRQKILTNLRHHANELSAITDAKNVLNESALVAAEALAIFQLALGEVLNTRRG